MHQRVITPYKDWKRESGGEKSERDKDRGGKGEGRVISRSGEGFSCGTRAAIVNPFTLEFNRYKTRERWDGEKQERMVFHLHLAIAGPLE